MPWGVLEDRPWWRERAGDGGARAASVEPRSHHRCLFSEGEIETPILPDTSGYMEMKGKAAARPNLVG